MNDELKDLEAILEHVREVVDTARPVPLSASVMVNREELLQLVDDVLDNLPDEFRKARWIMKERDEVLERARRDADDVLANAREESRRMVEQQEIVKKASRYAQSVLDDAKMTARERVLQAEDYIDQKLGHFEVALQKTIDTVEVARTKLRRGNVAEEDFTDPPRADESFDGRGSRRQNDRYDEYTTPPPQHFDVVDQTGEHFFDQDGL